MEEKKGRARAGLWLGTSPPRMSDRHPRGPGDPVNIDIDRDPAYNLKPHGPTGVDPFSKTAWRRRNPLPVSSTSKRELRDLAAAVHLQSTGGTVLRSMVTISGRATSMVTVGTRLFCQRPELFPKDTTRPLYAKPQSEHSLTRDTQWVGGSHKRHRTATA